MKTKMIVCIVCILTLYTYMAEGATQMHLVDISGSGFMRGAQDIFEKNMKAMNINIDDTGTSDKFFIHAFRSNNAPWRIVDFEFPNRRGGRDKNLLKARKELRASIQHGFNAPPEDFQSMGGGTDIIGALSHSILFLADQSGPSESIVLKIYSDGLQTTGVGSVLHLMNVQPYSERLEKSRKYLESLEKKLSKAMLAKPPRLDLIVWLGALYGEDLGLKSNDLALFESRLRELWATWLAGQLPDTQITYLLKY